MSIKKIIARLGVLAAIIVFVLAILVQTGVGEAVASASADMIRGYHKRAEMTVRTADKTFDLVSPHMAISSAALESGLLSVSIGVDDYRPYQLEYVHGDSSHHIAVTNGETVVPLCFGDGEYEIRLLRHETGNQYAPISTQTVVAHNSDEAYLYTNSIVRYDESSLPESASYLSGTGSIDADISHFVRHTLVYNNERRDAILSGVVRSFDGASASDIVERGDGVCSDFAILTAAIYREMGIPCRVCIGYVSDAEELHCWNQALEDGVWKNIDNTYSHDADATYNVLYAY